MQIDLHNHTPLCKHANGEPQEYIQQAISKGIDIFGFSDHAPMNFDQNYRMDFSQTKNYEKYIKTLATKYQNQIEILLGYEVDFLNNDKYFNNDILNAKVDYLIGSVHFIDEWGFDNPEFIGEYKNKDINKIWEDYFYAIKLLAKSGYFQIVGHLDLIKVFNFLPTKDIKTIAKDAIKEIKKQNLVVEINSAGFRKPISEQYPSKELLELIYEYDIDITFGSDAHEINQISSHYEQAFNLAKNIGFTKQVYFKNKDKIKVDLI